ncbi:MAG: hypothetical protein LBT47_03170 [Deltaproteobacteria bacterium]|nr:hypothetical protein [Deltaproteobacteria bacterium]
MAGIVGRIFGPDVLAAKSASVGAAIGSPGGWYRRWLALRGTNLGLWLDWSLEARLAKRLISG